MLSRNYYLLNTIIKKNVVTKHDHTYVLPINFLIFITFRTTTHTRENRRLDESIRRHTQHKF